MNKVEWERNTILRLKEVLKDNNFYEPVSVDIHFPEHQNNWYVFICNLKKFGIPIANTILFAQYYEGSDGRRYLRWHKNPDSDEQLTECNGVIDNIMKIFLKLLL